MRMDDYKKKWLDIVNVGSLKMSPRAPKKSIEAMAKVTNNPTFVRNVMQEWKEGKISDDEVCDKLKDKFGDAGYKKIEKAGMKALH